MTGDVKFYTSTGSGMQRVGTLSIPLHTTDDHGQMVYMTPSYSDTSNWSITFSDDTVASYSDFGKKSSTYMSMYVKPLKVTSSPIYMTVEYHGSNGDYEGTIPVEVYDDTVENVHTIIYMHGTPTTSATEYGVWNKCDYRLKAPTDTSYGDWITISSSGTFHLPAGTAIQARWYDGDSFETSDQTCDLITNTYGYPGTGVTEVVLQGANASLLPAKMQYSYYDARFSDASGKTLDDPLVIYVGDSMTLRYGYGNATSYEFTTDPTGFLTVTDQGTVSSSHRDVTITGIEEGNTTLIGTSDGPKDNKSRGSANVEVKGSITTIFYMNYSSTDMTKYATLKETLGRQFSFPAGVPEWKGHTFQGWFTSRSGGTQITSSTIVAKNSPTELYAHWEQSEEDVTGVSLNMVSVSLTKGETANLVATVRPSTAIDRSVTWASSNPSIVSIAPSENSCLCTAVAAGTSRVTVRTNDGGYTASCTFTISGGSAPDIYLDEVLYVGEEYNGTFTTANGIKLKTSPDNTVPGITFRNE